MEKLETKLKQLNLGVLRTKNVLDSGKSEKINDWNNETDAKIGLADVEIDQLESWLAEKGRSEHLVAQENSLMLS